jgi:hypothetical protein
MEPNATRTGDVVADYEYITPIGESLPFLHPAAALHRTHVRSLAVVVGSWGNMGSQRRVAQALFTCCHPCALAHQFLFLFFILQLFSVLFFPNAASLSLLSRLLRACP